MKNNVWSDDTYEMSLVHYQMTTNSAINRNLACVVNDWNNSLYYELIKPYTIFAWSMSYWYDLRWKSLIINLILLGGKIL